MAIKALSAASFAAERDKRQVGWTRWGWSMNGFVEKFTQTFRSVLKMLPECTPGKVKLYMDIWLM